MAAVARSHPTTAMQSVNPFAACAVCVFRPPGSAPLPPWQRFQPGSLSPLYCLPVYRFMPSHTFRQFLSGFRLSCCKVRASAWALVPAPLETKNNCHLASNVCNHTYNAEPYFPRNPKTLVSRRLPAGSLDQRPRFASWHRLWSELRRYLIVFEPLTFVLD